MGFRGGHFQFNIDTGPINGKYSLWAALANFDSVWQRFFILNLTLYFWTEMKLIIRKLDVPNFLW